KCQNNLKQLGLAAVNYHDTNNGFPLVYKFIAKAGLASPFVVLLPYLEQQGLYQALYQQENLGTLFGNQASPFATPVSVLVCPSDSGIPSPGVINDSTSGLFVDLNHPGYYALTSYRSASGVPRTDPNSRNDGAIVLALPGSSGSSVRILAITDGTSNTVLFGEFSNF